ncbi:AEC family transporter [Myceligenerans halotolerans]
MQLVTTGIVPIVLVLALGVLLRRRVLTEPAFWRGLERLSCRVFTPALFVSSIAGADLRHLEPLPILLSLAIPTVAVAGLLAATRRPLRLSGPGLTSMIQGSIRINTYIGLVFATALHGAPGIAAFAIASAVVVPLVNVVCVSSLARHGVPGRTARTRRLWRELVTNPLIQACLAGLALNLAGLRLPEAAAVPLDLLAAPALVTGTLVAGAAITFEFRRRDLLDVALASVLKLVVMPLAAWAIASAFGVAGPTLTAIVLITAVPTAPSATVLATQMGGDIRLIASITGVQTVLAMATLPAAISLLAT